MSTKTKHTKVLTDNQLRIERTRYNLLVDNNISNTNFNENLYKTLRNFIYFTVILGGIFTWSSSSNTSNIYILLNKYFDEETISIVLPAIILGLLFVPFIAIIFNIINVRKKVCAQSLISEYKQNQIFKEFIKKEISNKEGTKIDNLEQLYEIIKKMNTYDVIFTQTDFKKFLMEYLEKYKCNFPLMFESNYANLILLNECIENTLVQIHNDSNSKYCLIISENYNLL